MTMMGLSMRLFPVDALKFYIEVQEGWEEGSLI